MSVTEVQYEQTFPTVSQNISRNVEPVTNKKKKQCCNCCDNCCKKDKRKNYTDSDVDSDTFFWCVWCYLYSDTSTTNFCKDCDCNCNCDCDCDN